MKKLKKIVLRIPIYPKYVEFFGLFEKYELIQIHRQDNDQIFVTQNVKFKDSKMHPKMLEGEHYGVFYVEMIEENKDNGEYIFFSKNQFIQETKDLFENQENLIIDSPYILDGNRILVSIITDKKNIDQFFESVDYLFSEDVEILSISNMHIDYKHLFLKLTERQKEIIFYAVLNGYFEIPRKIEASEIADHFNISQSALYEHLRRIDIKIYHSIFK